MTAAAMPVPLKFQIGARTLGTIRRRLHRVALDLEDVLAGTLPSLPPLRGDGYLVTSLPEALLPRIASTRLMAAVRQRYVRYHADLTQGYDAWAATLSGQARSSLKRKAKRLAAESGGTLDIRHYRTPDEIAAFHPLARRVSAATYQERLLDAGLPVDPVHLLALSAADGVRAWLLFRMNEPIAYLCCTAMGDTLCYTHVGHDPAFGERSPGTVLMAEAMRQSFADRFRRFDFTEGEGQHKRLFASDGTPCVDVLLLRPTLANRLLLATLASFDRIVAAGKRAAAHPRLSHRLRRLRR